MLVVQGITNEGRRFRPSAWIDMLVGRYMCPTITYTQQWHLTSAEADRCVEISKHIIVCCCNKSGHCELRLDGVLKTDYPVMYNRIKDFAISNNLVYTETEVDTTE